MPISRRALQSVTIRIPSNAQLPFLGLLSHAIRVGSSVVTCIRPFLVVPLFAFAWLAMPGAFAHEDMRQTAVAALPVMPAI
jgi:hypothetical protein